MEKLHIRESVRAGWEIFRKRPLIIMGSFAIAIAVSGIVSALLDPGENAPLTVANVALSFITALVGLFVELGLITFSLRAHQSVGEVAIKDLWNPQVFLHYVGGQILVGVMVILGLVLLIVPGIILALGLMFTPYLIVERGMSPVAALKESWRITKGHKGQLSLFVLTIIGINVLGLLALVVGLFVSIPVSMLAVVHVYKTLEHRAGSAPLPA